MVFIVPCVFKATFAFFLMECLDVYACLAITAKAPLMLLIVRVFLVDYNVFSSTLSVDMIPLSVLP